MCSAFSEFVRRFGRFTQIVRKTSHSGVAIRSVVVRPPPEPIQRIEIICGNLRNLRMFLLVTQGFNRVERGGFARWIKTEEDADGCAE